MKTHLTVQAAAEESGYNGQYLQQLLGTGRLEGDKIGHVWLIRKDSFEEFLRQGLAATDRRFGQKSVIG